MDEYDAAPDEGIVADISSTGRSDEGTSTSSPRYVPEIQHSEYKPGDTITKDLPILYVLMPMKVHSHCYHCIKPAKVDDRHLYFVESLKECPECRMVSYCSEECKIRDEFHRLECRILQTAPPPDTHLARVALKFLIMLRCGGQEFLEQNKETFKVNRFLADLETYPKAFEEDPNLSEGFGQAIDYVTMIGNEWFPENGLPTGEDLGEVEEHLIRFINHAVHLRNSEGIYAACLFLRVTVFYHSCKPNSIMVLDGTYLKVRAIRRIAANELITLCFANPFDEYETRHAAIKQYSFECDCVRNEEIPTIKNEYREIREMVERLKSGPEKEVIDELFRKWTNLIVLMEAVVSYHPLIVERYMEFLKVMVEHDNLAEFPAVEFFNSVKYVYGKYHPIHFVLLEILTVASEKKTVNKKLLKWKNKIEESLESIRRKIKTKTPKHKKKLQLHFG